MQSLQERKNKGETLHLSSVDSFQIESNSKIKINFDGGDLSYDSGLLLIKEFTHKFGFDKHIGQFKLVKMISSVCIRTTKALPS